VVLKEKADPPRPGARVETRDIDLIETHCSCMQGQRAADAAKQRALAATVGSQDGEQLAPKYIKIDAAEDFAAAVAKSGPAHFHE
jgi:hypothetical protein